MLQTNLIFGIQKKIKEGSKHASKMGLNVIEENETLVEEGVKQERELVLESSFISSMYQKAKSAKKKESFKKELITESFHISKASKKLEKDITYFNYLYENFVPDVFQEQYKMLLESIFEDTIKLYQECDVTPRLVSPALDSNELTENQMVDIYRNRLNKNIKNNYTKPLLSGEITTIYENEIRNLTKKLITEGADINMDQVKIYLPFEEAFYKFNKDILIPEIAEKRIQAFMESITPEYLEFIEESAEDLLRSIEKKIKLLTSIVSPNAFDAAVDAEGIDAPKMAGISITIDKNFDGGEDCDDGICPDDVAAMDPEAAEEMADEEEAESLEDETSDINGVEAKVRDDMELANDVEDYEDTNSMEEEAEESAEEETAENPDQPGAIEMDLGLDDGAQNAEGLVTNDSDVALSGDGQDTGIDPNGGDATLPGGANNVGVEADSDDGILPDGDIGSAEEVPSDDTELSDDEESELEDVSEKKEEKDGELAESTIQDKKPGAQNTSNNSGSMPGGGTTQDKNISKGQGGASKSKGSMPGGKTGNDKGISKAKNTSNSKGSMPVGGTTQDKNIAGAKGAAGNSKGSMPGGGTTQDKNISKKRG